jgi:riboflavin synthase
MFTGIIETIGTVKQITENGNNKTFWVASSLFPELKIDQSLSHNGVCLTVEELKEGLHRVTAVKETLDKTDLNQWKSGTQVNLERSLLPSSRLDGHFVQGHIDTIGLCKKIKEENGSWELEFEFAKKFAELIIEKGSICINGISLTAFDVKKKTFKVAIIPYTWQNTNLQHIKAKDTVNLEFDLIGKYITRKLSLKR